MANKKSSFHMGNEFNGYGDETYLKGTERRTYAPLSQENVHLTRDFSSLLLKALGGIPLVLNTQSVNLGFMAIALGGIAVLNQVVIMKDAKTGMYTFTIYAVPTNGFTNGAYLQTTIMPNEVPLAPGMIQAGWEEQEDRRWKYRNSKGKYVCGDWVDYNGNRYYLDSEGYMVIGWKQIGWKKWYYFKSNINGTGHEGGGQMVSGWRKIGGLWYYFHPEKGYMMTGWQTIDGKKYYLKKEKEAINGNDYGYMLTGWREIGNKWYYFHDEGDMAVSEWIEENGKRYWVGEDGVWVEGTKKDPVIFEDGEENSVSGKEVWIQCDTRGATDFYVKTNKRAKIKIYKDKMFSDKILYDVTGTSLKKTFSDSTVNNNANTYLVHVKADSEMMVTGKVNTHIDTYSYSKGAKWFPHDSSARYYTMTLEWQYWYVDNVRVSSLINLVNRSDFLDFQTILVNEGVAAGLVFLSHYGGGLKNEIAKRIISLVEDGAAFFTAMKSPVNFKESVLSEIDEAAGYVGTDSMNMSIYERGVCLREVFDVNSSFYFYEITSWVGPEMEGPKGWTGRWEKNKKLEES